MTLKHLEIFRTVCLEHTMTKASKSLHMTQPAISRAIAELEAYYDIKLFERIGKRLLLTDAGKQMLTDAESVLHEFEALELHAGFKKPASLLKIGCSLGIGFGYMDAYMNAFEKVCPETKVHVIENATSVLQAYLLSGELDFAIVEGFITEESLSATSFFADEVVLLAAPSCPLADGHLIKAWELADQDFLIPDKMTGTRAIFDNVMASHGIVIAPIWSGINLGTLIMRAKAGKGIAVVSRRWAEQELSEGTLVALPTEFQMKRAYSLVYHKNKNLSEEAVAFMEICRSVTNQNPGKLMD